MLSKFPPIPSHSYELNNLILRHFPSSQSNANPPAYLQLTSTIFTQFTNYLFDKP